MDTLYPPSPLAPRPFWGLSGPAESTTLVALAGGMALTAMSPWADPAAGVAVFVLGVALGATGTGWALLAKRPATDWAQRANELGMSWSERGEAEHLNGSFSGRRVSVRVWAGRMDLTCLPFRPLERDFPCSSQALARHLQAIERGTPPVTSLVDPITRAAFADALASGLEIRALAGQVSLRGQADPEQLPALLERLVGLCMTLDQSRLRRKTDTLF